LSDRDPEPARNVDVERALLLQMQFVALSTTFTQSASVAFCRLGLSIGEQLQDFQRTKHWISRTSTAVFWITPRRFPMSTNDAMSSMRYMNISLMQRSSVIPLSGRAPLEQYRCRAEKPMPTGLMDWIFSRYCIACTYDCKFVIRDSE
jgi:hypothetical protein